MTDRDVVSFLMAPAEECPPWCSMTGPHAAHGRPVGTAGAVGVAVVQGDAWEGPQVLVMTRKTAERDSASVVLAVGRAADLAAVFRAAGNDAVADLIDAARVDGGTS